MKISEVKSHIIEIQKKLDRASKTMTRYTRQYGSQRFSNIDLLSLPPDDFFALTGILSAQQKALMIEQYIVNLYNGMHIAPSENRGDFILDDEYYEIKISTNNQMNALNIRQIRLYQDIDYYICAYLDETDLKQSQCFILTKKEMQTEIQQNGSFSHGTKQENARRRNPEYSITLPLDSALMLNWKQQYWNDFLYNKLTEHLAE